MTWAYPFWKQVWTWVIPSGRARISAEKSPGVTAREGDPLSCAKSSSACSNSSGGNFPAHSQPEIAEQEFLPGLIQIIALKFSQPGHQFQQQDAGILRVEVGPLGA